MRPSQILLEELEGQLKQIIAKDKKNWIGIAQRLLRIEQDELYLYRCPSWSRYLTSLAVECRVHVSTLWRARSAAITYMEISGKNSITDLSQHRVPVTGEQLEMLKKVKSIAPEKIVASVQEKLLAGEPLRNDLKTLWDTYKPLKKGKTERGRKQKIPSDLVLAPAWGEIELPPTGQDDQLAAFLADQAKRMKYQVTGEEADIANIRNALTSVGWLVQSSKTWAEAAFAKPVPDVTVKHEGKPLKFDQVIVARAGNQFTTWGILVRVALPAIEQVFLKEQEYLQFVHQVVVAAPAGKVFEKWKPAKKCLSGLLAVTDTLHLFTFRKILLKQPTEHQGEPPLLYDTLKALLFKTLEWEQGEE